jgi:hypothetical protein
LAVHSGKKQDCRYFLEKIYNWQQILWENMIGNTFWEKNIIDNKFWGGNMTDSTFWEKHDWQHILGRKHD